MTKGRIDLNALRVDTLTPVVPRRAKTRRTLATHDHAVPSITDQNYENASNSTAERTLISTNDQGVAATLDLAPTHGTPLSLSIPMYLYISYQSKQDQMNPLNPLKPS